MVGEEFLEDGEGELHQLWLVTKPECCAEGSVP